MKIYVTDKHIKAGLKEITSNSKCPVARALRSAGFRNIWVGVTHARTQYSADILLPKKAWYAIHNMCQDEGMSPFYFTLTEKQVNILKGKS